MKWLTVVDGTCQRVVVIKWNMNILYNKQTDETVTEMHPMELKKSEKGTGRKDDDDVRDLGEEMDGVKHEVGGDVVETSSAARKPESTIHTSMENLYLDSRVSTERS